MSRKNVFASALQVALYFVFDKFFYLKLYKVRPKIWNEVGDQACLRELSFRVNATLDTTDPREMPSDSGRRKKEEGRREAPYENRELNRGDGHGRGSKVVDRPISPYPHYGFTGIIPFQNAVRMCGFELGSSPKCWRYVCLPHHGSFENWPDMSYPVIVCRRDLIWKCGLGQ